MKIINVQQGTSAWHAHRAEHWNASDAPAMMGVSPHKTRSALLDSYMPGHVAPEIDTATQARFNDGHRFEALARPLAEKIIGDELYPVTGSACRLSASFDGLTMDEETAFEHKSLNDELRSVMVDGCIGADLPLTYQIQMEQQLIVSGASRALFMASKWGGEELVEERHCWYSPNPDLRARIIAGWKQFEADLAAHVVTADALQVVGRAPDQLPALRIEVTGMVTASNLAEFKENALAVIGSINTDLTTDEDFANADKTVKWCGEVEARIEAAKQHALSQTASIDELFRALDAISGETRAKRLELDKLVKYRKEAVKGEIVHAGRDAVADHYAAINATLGAHALLIPASVAIELAVAIKGKRTLSSMRDAVATAVAGAKIDASERADRVRACRLVLDEYVTHAALFPDAVALCASKAPDDLRNLAAMRAAAHARKEVERIEADRLRIRAEEVAKLEELQRKADAEKALADRDRELSEIYEARRLAASAAPAVDPIDYDVKIGQADSIELSAKIGQDGDLITGKAHPIKQTVTDPNQPARESMIGAIAAHYRVTNKVALAWLQNTDWSKASA